MTTQHTESTSFADALAEFDEAWADPLHTAVELPAVDVNRVLAERYVTDPKTSVTRDQVWDMEVRKAWNPLGYIPYVVTEGVSWAATDLVDGSRRHLRSSIQKAWTDDTRGRVLEEVVTEPGAQRILFLGRARMEAEDGTALEADPYQPLFHVEHAVGGTAEQPTNIWRIVSLTEEPDAKFREFFDGMVRTGWLPGFLEIYIEQDLGVTLRRR